MGLFPAGMEPTSPAWAGGFFTTEPPEAHLSLPSLKILNLIASFTIYHIIHSLGVEGNIPRFFWEMSFGRYTGV